MIFLLLVAGLLTWVGATLVIDGWHTRRSRPSLAKRLAPFQVIGIADEARRWLDAQR